MNWTPVGYLVFSEVPQFIAINLQYNGRFRDEEKSQSKLLPHEALPLTLGADLASGIIRATGAVRSTGKFIWIPAEAWRCKNYLDGNYISAIEMAMLGLPISFWREDKSSVTVMPFISQSDFCRWYSEEPLEGLVEPPLTPDGLNVTVSGAPLSAEARSTLWMRAYALGMNHAGSKPKRDDTLKLCQTEVRVTWRQAKTAWEALPAEWRNANRRPK